MKFLRLCTLMLWALMMVMIILSPAKADDIDIYISSGSDYGLQSNQGNSSTLTFILDDSTSMDDAIDDSSMNEDSNEEWWDELERRTALKNAFTDFISSAPEDLKIIPFLMNEIEDDPEDFWEQPDNRFLSHRFYSETSKLSGNDYRQRVIDHDDDGSVGTELSFGRYECNRNTSSNAGYLCSGSGYDYDTTYISDFGTSGANYALAMHFPMPGFNEEGSASSATETADLLGRDVVGMFITGFDLNGPGSDANFDGIVDDPSDNAELLVRIYDRGLLATGSDSSQTANASIIFANNTATATVQPLAEFTLDYYPVGYKEGGHFSENIYRVPESAISGFASQLENGSIRELSFIFYKKTRTNITDFGLDYYYDEVELHIEHTSSNEQLITSKVQTIGSDAIEDASGEVYDLNLNDPAPSDDFSMRELRVNANNKAAMRFMLLPFDSANSSTIDTMALRLYPASALASNANVTLYFNSLGEPGQIIPIESGGVSLLIDQSNVTANVLVNATLWNTAFASGGFYELALPNSMVSAIKGVFSRSSWSYHDAITLAMTSSSSNDLHFYSYEHSHALHKQDSLSASYSEQCLDLKQTYELRSDTNGDDDIDLRMCERYVAPTLAIYLDSAFSFNSVQFPSTQREKLIREAYYLPAQGNTPMHEAYANTLNYLLGYYNTAAKSYQESPLVEIDAKACGFFDSVILLTDGEENAGGGEYLSSTLDAQDEGGDWGEAIGAARYMVETGHDADGDQDPDNSFVFGLNSYGVLFGDDPEDGFSEFVEAAGTAVYNDDGDPQPYTAVSSYGLVKAFQTIQFDALTISSQVSTVPDPAANPVNSFETSDELYYPLFKPNDQQYWPGNLKRYSFWPNSANGNA